MCDWGSVSKETFVGSEGSFQSICGITLFYLFIYVNAEDMIKKETKVNLSAVSDLRDTNCSLYLKWLPLIEDEYTYIWEKLCSPWIRRTFNGFLTVLSPCPQIRRHYFSSRPAVCSRRRRNTDHLLSLALPACPYNKLKLNDFSFPYNKKKHSYILFQVF